MGGRRCRSTGVRLKSGSLCKGMPLGRAARVGSVRHWTDWGCATARGSPMPIWVSGPWTGATHPFGVPGTARRRLGCALPSHPRLGSLPSISPVPQLVAPVRRSSRLQTGRCGLERNVPAHLEERQGAPGGLPEVEDEARAVAPSERQARPGGRRHVAAIVLNARAKRRASEPALAPGAGRRHRLRRPRLPRCLPGRRVTRHAVFLCGNPFWYSL